MLLDLSMVEFRRIPMQFDTNVYQKLMQFINDDDTVSYIHGVIEEAEKEGISRHDPVTVTDGMRPIIKNRTGSTDITQSQDIIATALTENEILVHFSASEYDQSAAYLQQHAPNDRVEYALTIGACCCK